MGIKFSCTSCASVLNVKDEYAGKSAKCPKCQTVLKIPAVSEPDASEPLSDDFLSTPAPLPSSPVDPGFQAAASNPYAAPNSRSTGGRSGATGAAGAGRPTAVEPGQVLSHAMQVWQNNLGVLVGATAIFIAILFALSFSLQFVMQAMIAFGQEPLIIFPVILGINIVQYLAQWFLTLGMTKIALSLARGKPTTVGTLFDGEYFGAYAIASFLGTLALVVGATLLVVPAIFLGLYFWPYGSFIADGKAGAFDSFGKASEIAKLNLGTTLVLALASMGIMLAGLLALCVGVLFAVPLVSVIWATAYLMMCGEIR